jgi:PmbA protein
MPDTAAPDLSTLTVRLLEAARRAGAGAADAIAVRDASVSIDVRGGRLEEAQRAEGVEIGLRVLIGGRQACVSASDTSDRTMTEMAERAVAMARLAPEDPFAGLADPDQLTADRDAGPLDLIDPSPEPEPAWLEDQARAAEAAALAVPGVTQCEGAGAGWGRRDAALAATNGFAGAYGRTSVSLSVSAITRTGTGMERDWAGEGRIHRADLPAADGIGRLAGERAVARAGARKPPTGAFPVLYDERVAGQLIGHLLSAINGQSLARGSSWLRDALGEAVLPAGLSLTEDPRRPRQSGSRPFDAEGLACVPRDIVTDGVLVSYTLDLASARKLGMAPTGHAMRGAGGPPSPGNGNIALTQGTASRDDLIRGMGTGLLVTSMIGASINSTTGDYSRGASGFWVENGQIAYPVNECTIAGNLRAMLRTLVPANDARPHLSRVVPSVLVDGLTVAGA